MQMQDVRVRTVLYKLRLETPKKVPVWQHCWVQEEEWTFSKCGFPGDLTFMNSLTHLFVHAVGGSNDSTMLWQAGGVEISEHILYVSLSLKCNTCSGWNARCRILLRYLQNMFIFPLLQTRRMLIGLSRACSHRHDTKETVPTLTAHISAVSVLTVSETGFSRTKSSPDLGEKNSLVLYDWS